MITLRLWLVGLMLLLLGAHFLRAGNLVAMVGVFAIMAMLFLRRPWVARALQISLVLGSLEWLRTMALQVGARREEGLPFLRLAFILGGVALLTGLCALLLQGEGLRRYFQGMPERD